MGKELLHNLNIGATELMLLLGLGMLFAGLWLWLGLGIALAVCGAALVLTALINAWMQHRETMKAMGHAVI